MRIALALLCLSGTVLAVEKAPTAKPMGTTVSDSDLLSKKNLPGNRRVRAHGVVKDEVDDYNDFDTESVKNRDNGGLKAVTYTPITQKYDIPKAPETSTLSPIPIASGKLAKNTQLYTWSQPNERKGYFFMHYPWHMLPKQYRLNPSYQFVYPPNYQNTVYAYPSNPHQDPYGVYRHLIPCGRYGSYGCGYQSPCGGRGGCGGGGCGGGGGGAGGCGDTEGYSGDNDDEEEESGEETEEGGRSGETGINKKDPLDDLDLEDLEKLDKDKGDEERRKKQKKHH